jgi:hypothetical protein
LLAAEEDTPESRLVLVEFVQSTSVQDPVIKVAGEQSDSIELNETVSEKFRLRSCYVPARPS